MPASRRKGAAKAPPAEVIALREQTPHYLVDLGAVSEDGPNPEDSLMSLLKQTARTFKGSGRNRGRTCVQIKTNTKGKTRKTKGGGKLKDSGVRFAGCFGSAAAAAKAVARIKGGGALKTRGGSRKRKSSKRGRRKK
jgi:hypothetical protein